MIESEVMRSMRAPTATVLKDEYPGLPCYIYIYIMFVYLGYGRSRSPQL